MDIGSQQRTFCGVELVVRLTVPVAMERAFAAKTGMSGHYCSSWKK